MTFGGITMTETLGLSAGRIACTVGSIALAGAFLWGDAALSENLPNSAMPPHDPGVRGGAPGAGGPVSGLDAQSSAFFQAGLDVFGEIEGVALGLGPRFNLDNCAGCHAQPVTGGTSPSTNPQIAAAAANGAQNSVPSFVSPKGPVREARYVSDGQVHGLFVITGRGDAPGCAIAQPDLAGELSRANVTFRIPTPLFGAGLIENTADQDLVGDVAALADQRAALGISGHFNYTGNDGTIARFGWKAQNKSLMMFAGEAYNVEMGITNELFPNEREYDSGCQYNALPEDTTDGQASVSDVTLFTAFMRLLAAPVPASTTPSTTRGEQVFNNAGCDLCHIPQHTTAASSFAGLNKVSYRPFSDFAVHNIGEGLRDQIVQGYASGDEFRTAPLWGVGQRIFFLHDGRTDDLLQAILAHGGAGSEANGLIANFKALSTNQQQDLLNFLRSL
jgi:CxxC motif-containing protein (DUF1111 family)